MSIHTDHPFADPHPDPVRRLRGRLSGAVSLWTAGTGGDRAGLSVTSLMLAAGEPARLLALVDPDSDLLLAVEQSGTALVQLLDWSHRGLADMFAGTAPAAGGLFAQADFEQTEWGPRLADAGSWAGVRLESTAEVGWSTLLTCVIESVTIGGEAEALGHRRGRYHRYPS